MLVVVFFFQPPIRMVAFVHFVSRATETAFDQVECFRKQEKNNSRHECTRRGGRKEVGTDRRPNRLAKSVPKAKTHHDNQTRECDQLDQKVRHQDGAPRLVVVEMLVEVKLFMVVTFEQALQEISRGVHLTAAAQIVTAARSLPRGNILKTMALGRKGHKGHWEETWAEPLLVALAVARGARPFARPKAYVDTSDKAVFSKWA